ncbi:MAG TPA: hypothetical protein PLE77_11620 [Kiritimatiellia bacterium]|nr:hypothetical protein [Kiritimatiellia bacterium]
MDDTLRIKAQFGFGREQRHDDLPEKPDRVLAEGDFERLAEFFLDVGFRQHRIEYLKGLCPAATTSFRASGTALPTGLKVHVLVLLTTISKKAGNGLMTLLNYSSLMRILSRNIEGRRDVCAANDMTAERGKR